MLKTYKSVNNWLVDLPSGSIVNLVSGERKRLGEYQLKLLDVLVNHAGKILTREELTTQVWERRVIGNNSLPNAIHALRTALDDDGKKQKIIKTIPKKGYLLEKDWCQTVDHESDEIDQLNTQVDEETTHTDDDLAIEKSEFYATTSCQIEPEIILEHEPIYTRKPLQVRNLISILTILVLVIFLCVGVAWQYASTHMFKLIATEQAADVWSNIRIYEISESDQLAMNKEDFYSQFKDTLYTINQELKSQEIYMNVYYHNVDQTLNYTFSLKNDCDNTQLVMAIYHFRIAPIQLNNLIMRETRRKIHEMDTCA